MVKHCKMKRFADDTMIYVCGNNLRKVILFKTYQLFLKFDKSKAMVLLNLSKNNVNITMNDLKRVKKACC